jgi:hypothetical protein
MLHRRQAPGRDAHKHFSLAPAPSSPETLTPSHLYSPFLAQVPSSSSSSSGRLGDRRSVTDGGGGGGDDGGGGGGAGG